MHTWPSLCAVRQASDQRLPSRVSYSSRCYSDYKLLHPPILADKPASLLLPLRHRALFFSLACIKPMVLTDSFPCMILHKRNLACRGCGCPRSESQVSPVNRQALGMSSTRLPSSPRFANAAGATPFYPAPSIPSPSHYSTMQHGARHPLAVQPVTGAKPASPSHPLLTPSGRSFSVGGKVQNISSDPAAPCVMYWPDNEPFPEQGQIRPSSLSGVTVSRFGTSGDFRAADAHPSNPPS